MEFPLTNHVIGLVKAALARDHPNDFAEIRCAVLSGFSNLIELLPELSLFPAAVITAGSIRPIDQGATRETEVSIIVVDEFRCSADDTRGFNLIDRTVARLSSDIPGQPLTIGRVHFVFHSVTPLDLSSTEHCAWNLTFIAKSSFI
jgi:hypothetical protein